MITQTVLKYSIFDTFQIFKVVVGSTSLPNAEQNFESVKF